MDRKTIMLIAEEDRDAVYEKLSTFAEKAEVGDMLNCNDLKLRVVEFVPLRSERQHYGLVAIYKTRWKYVLYLDTEFSFMVDQIPMLPHEADVRDNRAIWEYMAENHCPRFEKYSTAQWELYDASSFDDWGLSPTQYDELRAFLNHDRRLLYLDHGEANMYIDFIGIVPPKKGAFYNAMALFWHNDAIIAVISIPETGGMLYPTAINKELNIN